MSLAYDPCEAIRALGRADRRLAAIIRHSGMRIMELSTLQAAQRVYAELLRMAQPDAAVPGLWVVRPLPPMHEIAASPAPRAKPSTAPSASFIHPAC